MAKKVKLAVTAPKDKTVSGNQSPAAIEKSNAKPIKACTKCKVTTNPPK